MHEDLKSTAKQTEDEASLRPQTLAEFIGQQQMKDNLAVFIAAPQGGAS